MSAIRKTGLGPLIQRAENDSFFVSRVIKRYKALFSLDDSRLMELLNCTTEGLERLALCRFPDDRDDRYREHVRQIAAYVPCDVENLLKLFREVASLDSLHKDAEETITSGMLMAARDRKAETGTKSSSKRRQGRKK